jgi:hypothetical protein
MTSNNPSADVLSFDNEQKPALPSSLNVLTILTFVGCGLAFLGGIWNYVRADKAYQDIVAAQEKLTEAPAWAKKFMGPEMVEMARKSADNKLPILLLTLVGAGLCLYGAMEMRKLKKQGFALWAAGEYLPVVGGFIFVGSVFFSGFALIGLAIPIIFTILYALNKKHLIY